MNVGNLLKTCQKETYKTDFWDLLSSKTQIHLVSCLARLWMLEIVGSQIDKEWHFSSFFKEKEQHGRIKTTKFGTSMMNPFLTFLNLFLRLGWIKFCQNLLSRILIIQRIFFCDSSSISLQVGLSVCLSIRNEFYRCTMRLLMYLSCSFVIFCILGCNSSFKSHIVIPQQVV